MILIGFTDNVGRKGINLDLPRKRTQKVSDELVTKVVTKPYFEVATEGYGPAYTVASNETEDGKNRNRRGDLVSKVNQPEHLLQ